MSRSRKTSEVPAEKKVDCHDTIICRHVGVSDHTGDVHNLLSKKRDELESQLPLSKRICKYSWTAGWWEYGL